MALGEKTRNIVYGSGLIGTGAVIIAQAAGALTAESGSALVQIITLVGGLLGANAAGTATAVLASQRKNGAVIGDVALPTVEVPVESQLSTVEKMVQAVQEVQALDNQVRGGLTQLQEITGGLINIPGVMAMTPDLPGPLDDLIRGAGQRFSQDR